MNFIANFAEGGDWTFRLRKKGQINENKIAKIHKKEILIMINAETSANTRLGPIPFDVYLNCKEQVQSV